MRLMQTLIVLTTVLTTAAIQAPAQDKPLLGFGIEEAIEEFALEEQFDSYLERDNLRDWMRQLSARPHHVGSEYGRENAEFIASQFESWGYETTIEVFRVLFPTPRTRLLEMTRPTRFRATLGEPPLAQDRTSGQQDEQLPTYNAYSIDGDVTGEVVYVNYGIPEDYEELDRLGIDVTGKIVLARYGSSWRGIKPKLAAEKGAIGCILYSDPRDDGYFQGDVYPEGAFKNDQGVQRGSVQDMPLFPGDPLTPNIGATDNATRLEIEDAPTLTKIPVLPISYSDARPILEALGGPVAPPSWRSALPITHHLGPGPAEVHLEVEFDWNLEPAYNVIATMEGSEHPDQWIIRGNHHDAWVNGAQDPVSGMVALMEEARALSELRRAGWQPKRTVMYAAWDAEEPGLIGSTEWTETHIDELQDKVAVYINTDGYGRGFLQAGGSHTLEKFFNQVARDVIDPQKGISVADRRRASLLVNGDREAQSEAWERDDLRLAALGSGSDYTPFLQHLGIASLNIGYGGENQGGSYHSIYDSFDHYTRFGDPDFDYGIALAQTTGRTVLRLANAELLPFEFENLTDNVAGYVTEITELTDDMREETERENRLIREGRYAAFADPTETFVVPQPKDPVPYLNFAPLLNSTGRLEEAAANYGRALASFEQSNSSVSSELRQFLDQRLFQTERYMTREEGLPGRPWYKHQVYAPGFYTGYGVKTIPGVREAIEQRTWDEAEQQIGIASEMFERLADQIDQAANELTEASQE